MLFRTNAQSEAYEEALAEAEVPYVVQRRRAVLRAGRGARRRWWRCARAARARPSETPLADAVVEALAATGWQPASPPAGRRRPGAVGGAGRPGRRSPRSSRARRCRWRRGTGASLADFCDELARRAAQQHAPTVDGVTLASLHSAKGLEWDAVFLVGLADGTLPTTYAKTPDALEEERRLLYVGVTRARQWLWLSYAPVPRAGRPGRGGRAGSCRSSTAAAAASARRRGRR